MNWTCPYCDRAQYLTDNYSIEQKTLAQEKSTLGKLVLNIENIVCANAACKRLTLRIALFENNGYQQHRGYVTGERHQLWALLPESTAKPQPAYIPSPLREDYEEACKIKDASPKASATLARRCLQGMIHDFCKISKKRLVDEISELRDRVAAGTAPNGVTPESVEAIDNVRSIGNIGAHMEADINVIVDIDPDEAQILIELIEALFREWYVAAEKRKEHFAAIKKLAADKAAAKKQQPTIPPETTPAD